ncbi:hypothetical protein [Nocardia sp. CDC160]|uniref:hypothetical protein n=1 Tax=Nocardia sp. CDC160 TaxID=3112166 RepID=UPI002DB95C9F|nr:hypothetical protein [Nocardia sp. CDC160]MEC3916361.1 hypothetical protein [Nocardia sp. CDC160]
MSIVFEGQSVEWMIGQAKALLGELKRSSKYELYDGDRISDALSTASGQNRLRNFYVHGQWSTTSINHEDEDGFACRRRDLADPLVFYVTRSRLRKEAKEREVSVADVDALVEEIRALSDELKAAVDYAFEVQLALVDHQLLPEHKSMRPGEMGTDIGVVLEAMQRARRRGGTA